MRRAVFSILVDNSSGVLSRVAGLFSRRGYNIDSLTVGETLDPKLSRMTITVTGDDDILEQIEKQLAKLIDVKEIVELPHDESVCRELVLIKVLCTREERQQITTMADIYRANIVDVAKNSLIISLTGSQSKIDSFIALLDGFKIRQSPFWTIHFYLCDGGIARNLDVYAHGHNNDGIDLEMSRNILIEKCKFDQGDDGVVIKSGRNQDAWRLNTPTENVVIRDCHIVNAHTLLGIGSEMSGGVRNIYMHHCEAQDSVFRLFFAKTNHRRGGFIENIWMKNVRAGRMQRIMEVDTDVLYQWRDLVPTYKDSVTTIRDLYMDSVCVNRAEVILDLKGDERLPINNVSVKNIYVKELTDSVKYVKNARNIILEGLKYNN